MQPIRFSLQRGRTFLTRPWRAGLVRAMAARGRAPISVLFYHRVANSTLNDWTISCDGFLRHVDYCRRHFDLISLEEVQRRCDTATSFRPAVSFTFDDGYAENCRFALPLLIRHRIPCTYFVTIDHLKTGKPFSHDLEAGMPLPVHTLSEIRALADAGIEIGLHTRSHPDLTGVTSRKVLQSEIVDAAAELADMVGRPIRYFAFPFGRPSQLTPQAIEAVHEAGLIGFCSGFGAYNLPGQDSFHIRRIHGDPAWARMENWLTFDRAKLSGQPEIRYRPANRPPADEASRDPSQTVSRLPSPIPRTPSTRPLRTTFVITSMPVGGAETLLVNLLDRLAPQRIAAEVVCLKSPGPLGESIRSRHKVTGDLIRSKWDLRVLPKLVRHFRRRRTDAVITVGAGDKMFWGRLAARIAGVPVVCSALHSTGWPDGVGRLNRLLTPITDAFIAVAERHGRFLIEQTGFPAEQVAVIPNGIDCERFVPSDSAKPRLRSELGLPASARLVGIVAALRPEKNHSMFLQVAERIAGDCSGAHFVIVGDGPEREQIEAIVGQRGLAGRVHLLGTRHDTPEIVAALDAFLLCSHMEASPVSILEAAACGVPVISTDVGSVAETVVSDETGYLVSPGDVETMTRCLRGVLDDPARAHRLGAAGREKVLRCGSLEAMVAGYSELIETIYRQKCGILPDKRGNSDASLASTNSDAAIDLERIS